MAVGEAGGPADGGLTECFRVDGWLTIWGMLKRERASIVRKCES